MAELARGGVADRPWGRTLAALGLRGLTGQLALISEGKRFVIAFEHGAVVSATSPLTSDAAVRVALTGHLVSSSQVAEISRRQAMAPDRDEIDVIAELARLGPDHALRLRRRVIAQRAARTFSPSQGDFVVSDRCELPVMDGCELDVRAVIYMGARANLSEGRLAAELDQLGSWFKLKPGNDDDLPQYGFTDVEQPVIERLRDGGSIDEIEGFASSFVDARTVRAVVYALASYNACELGPVRPRRPTARDEAYAMTREVPTIGMATGATQPVPMLRGGPITQRPSASEPTPIAIKRPATAEPGAIQGRRAIPSEPTPIAIKRPTTDVDVGHRLGEMTPIAIKRPIITERTPTSLPRIGEPHMPRAARPTPTPTSLRRPDTKGDGVPAAPSPTSGTRPMPSTLRPPTRPPGPGAHAEAAALDAPTQRDATSSAYGSDPALRPPYDAPAPRDGSSAGLRVPGESSAGLRVPGESSAGLRVPREAQSSAELRMPTEAQLARATTAVRGSGTAEPKPDGARARGTGPRSVAGAESPQAHDVKALIAQRLKLLDQHVDHFQLLGVGQDAPPDAIRKAYFALARQLHPDRLAALGISDDGKHAQRLFAQINTGFATLSDPARRAQYVSVLRRGGEAQIRADEARAEELARKIVEGEDAFHRGELALKRDQPQAAIADFERAVQLNPDEADYHAALAWAVFVAAPDKAAVGAATRGALERAIQRSPKAVAARFFLGRVERMLGRDQDALRHFKDVLASAPGHAEAASEARVIEARLNDKPSGGGGLFGRKR